MGDIGSAENGWPLGPDSSGDHGSVNEAYVGRLPTRWTDDLLEVERMPAYVSSGSCTAAMLMKLLPVFVLVYNSVQYTIK